jgi:branched-chain amino acid transport system permease protein
MPVLSRPPTARRPWGLIALAPIVVVLIALPWFAGFGTQRLLVEVFTVFAIAMAWNLLAGFGGLVVVGQHAFVGVGAYGLFLISTEWGLNPFWLLPVAPAVAALFALLTAWPMFRLSGAHFAVGTWVMAEMLRIGALNNDTVGAGGGIALTTLRAFSRDERNLGIYWAALAVAVLALLVALLILKSRLGLALTSTRDSEVAARACGVPVRRTKLILWVLAAAITGAAGAVAYMNTLQVTPDAGFGLQWTAVAIFISVLGGIGRIEGPLLGTLVYFALREWTASFGAWYFIVLGLLAILTMVVAPGGAWSLVLRRWPQLDPFGVRRTAR